MGAISGPINQIARTPARVSSQAEANSLVLGLSKGLRVLILLNQRDDMSVAELSGETGIPRPTVHRILNTLMSDQLVTTAMRRGRYRVAIGARLLSQGYKEPSWLSDIAAPVLDRLQKRVTWPSDLATYSAGAMVVRRTTSHLSPLSTVEKHVGARIPMLYSAIGLAYLAACSEPLCGKICETLSEAAGPEARLARDREKTSRLLDTVRAQGYAVRDGGAFAPSSYALAVAVVVNGSPVGALNVMLFRSAVSVEKARSDILPHLVAAAADLGERLSAAQSDLSQL